MRFSQILKNFWKPSNAFYSFTNVLIAIDSPHESLAISSAKFVCLILCMKDRQFSPAPRRVPGAACTYYGIQVRETG